MGAKLATRASQVVERIIDFLAYLAGGALAFMALSVCVEVMVRALLGFSLLGVIEVNECLLVYIVFLPAAWVLKRNQHVRMEILLDRLSSRSLALVNCITSALSSVVCLVIAWYSASATWFAIQRGINRMTAVEIPLSLFFAPIIIGCLLLLIQFLKETHASLISWRDSESRRLSRK